MKLTHIEIYNYRNITKIVSDLDNNFNLFYGYNGHGKTNLLEAVYLTGNARSFRKSCLHDLIMNGESSSLIKSIVEVKQVINSVNIVIEPVGRKVELNNKIVNRVSDIHGYFNSIVFSPDDMMMVKLGPDSRRRYLDRAIYTSDVSYLRTWHTYTRTLKQRNICLRSFDKQVLDVWTDKLAESGAELIVKRQKFVSELNNIINYHYSNISSSSEVVQLDYKSEYSDLNHISEIYTNIKKQLENNIVADMKYGITTAGPHRDDLNFLIDGKPLKSYASQGQQKSFVLALKLSEIDHNFSLFDEYPILILDDIDSELDKTRSRNLLEYLLSKKIQVLMSSTEKSPSFVSKFDKCKVFRIDNGNLTYEGT